MGPYLTARYTYTQRACQKEKKRKINIKPDIASVYSGKIIASDIHMSVQFRSKAIILLQFRAKSQPQAIITQKYIYYDCELKYLTIY